MYEINPLDRLGIPLEKQNEYVKLCLELKCFAEVNMFPKDIECCGVIWNSDAIIEGKKAVLTLASIKQLIE